MERQFIAVACLGSDSNFVRRAAFDIPPSASELVERRFVVRVLKYSPPNECNIQCRPSDLHARKSSTAARVLTKVRDWSCQRDSDGFTSSQQVFYNTMIFPLFKFHEYRV